MILFAKHSCSFILLLFCCINLGSVSAQCLQSQKRLLLELRNSLTYESYTKIAQWNESSDCCQWDGVECNSRGLVTGLDLSGESISGEISPIFRFESLESLNLAQNYFNSVFPVGFGSLSSLRYLNLSSSGFSGQVPVEISSMTSLKILDLSGGYLVFTLENPNLRTLIQNFSRLEELYLDWVNVSAKGYDWCTAVSSSLPVLRVLSLRNAYLTGPIDSSLTKLQTLEIIRLDGNTFSSPFPEFLGDFRNLRVLTLGYCNLSGAVPVALFQIPNLQTIDLSNNMDLEGCFPDFPVNSSLENLLLSNTNFSGTIPQTVGRLRMLSQFDLRACKFSGVIPNSFANLTHLVLLDLSDNHFTGSVPSFKSLRKLAMLNLRANSLSGQIPDFLSEGLEQLEYLDLGENSLEGEIPASLFCLPSLKVLSLHNNQLNGPIRDLGNNTLLSLETLELSVNNLDGMIPQFFSKMYNLSTLDLAQNNFSGSLDLSEFHRLTDLRSLDLSHNNLSVHVNVSIASLFPWLSHLNLASCNLQRIPNLRNQSSLMMLDLAENNIKGEIPNWLWDVGNGSLYSLNLSHNQFTSLQQPYRFHSLDFFDLHSNMISGQVPVPPPSVAYFDFSSNKFSSHLPDNIGNSLPSVFFFSIANNSITGPISTSLCKASNIQELDMSNNSLNGALPSCLVRETLHVLKLQKNNLTGSIPDMLPMHCGLETLDLSWNHLQGQLPKSLSRCSELTVVNLCYNNLTGAPPCGNRMQTAPERSFSKTEKNVRQ